jgi:hypothetical protein
MSRTFLPGVWLAIGLSLVLSGCAAGPRTTKMWDWLQSGDSEDNNDKRYKDSWAQVGKEGRGGRPMEDERDPFNKWFRSPKATAIENSLGIK